MITYKNLADSNLCEDFQKSTRSTILHKAIGYKSIQKQRGGSFGGVLVSFGGTNGYSLTNQIIAYRPGDHSSIGH